MTNSKLRKWTSNNKLLIFFILATLSLFVSTVALAALERDACKHLLDNHSSEDNNTTKMDKNRTEIEDENYYRLPRNVEPMNYRLMLNPNMINKTFDGSVMITIRVLQPIQTISLHTNNLVINSVSLKNSNNQSIAIISTNKTLDKRELLKINLEHEILKEYYKLFIRFSGRLDGKIVGFYASQLKNEKRLPHVDHDYTRIRKNDDHTYNKLFQNPLMDLIAQPRLVPNVSNKRCMYIILSPARTNWPQQQLKTNSKPACYVDGREALKNTSEFISLLDDLLHSLHSCNGSSLVSKKRETTKGCCNIM